MITIFKYTIPAKREFTLNIPLRHPDQFSQHVVDLQVQQGLPCLWVVVDTDVVLTPVRFRLIGTGSPFPEWGQELHEPIGTFQLFNGIEVHHLFWVL